jgi:hypothetical protein
VKKSGRMFARKIQGLHEMAAAFTQLDIIRITDDEANEIAMALDQVAKEFDVVIGGKTAAILNLAATLGMVYVPKGVMVFMMYQAAKMNAAAEAATDVTATEAAAAGYTGGDPAAGADLSAVAAAAMAHPAANSGGATIDANGMQTPANIIPTPSLAPAVAQGGIRLEGAPPPRNAKPVPGQKSPKGTLRLG